MPPLEGAAEKKKGDQHEIGRTGDPDHPAGADDAQINKAARGQIDEVEGDFDADRPGDGRYWAILVDERVMTFDIEPPGLCQREVVG